MFYKIITMLNIPLNMYDEWSLNSTNSKKVFDSVAQSEYHNITQYTSKIKDLRPYSLFLP